MRIPAGLPFSSTATAALLEANSFTPRCASIGMVGSAFSIRYSSRARRGGAAQDLLQQRPLRDRAHDRPVLEHRELGDVELLDEIERARSGLVVADRHARNVVALSAHHLGHGDRARVEEPVVAHPLVRMDLGEIALARVGISTTTRSPSFARRATVSATKSAVPADPPARIPSSRAREAPAGVQRLKSFTCTTSSITEKSIVPGMKSSPIPSTLYVRACVICFV